MSVQDFRKKLENTTDKLSVFASREAILKYDVTVAEILELIQDFLSDEEKLKLFDFPDIEKLTTKFMNNIIGLISEEAVKLQLLENDSIISKMDQGKIIELISGISDEARASVLKDTEFTKKIGLQTHQLMELTKQLSIDSEKLEIMDIYEFDAERRVKILRTCSDETKTEVILGENQLPRNNKIEILSSYDVKALAEFILANGKFCEENNISPYDITRNLDKNKQKEFVELLPDISLSLDEKKKILATLDEEVKASIDKESLPEEFKVAISIKTKYGKAIMDFERNLEDYRGLDNIIRIAPEDFTEEQRKRILELCDICPNMYVQNVINNILVPSYGSEYKEAEEWIQSVIDSLDPSYSKVQKLAVIDNAIGKKVSYSPDFDTEVSNMSDCRALWRIITSGYGVCNGIAAIEKYMLERVGIESEIINTQSHTFLKIKDIELPLANGEVVRGNTVLDPTWNLTDHRFGGKPENFCITYEEIRKHDIDDDKVDQMCHKADEELQDATIGLDTQTIRQVFSSVGLTRADGLFPVQDLLDESKAIDEAYVDNSEENINQQLALLSRMHPEFATCQNSTIKLLSGTLLNKENIKFNRCVVNRVYERADDNRRPVVFIYLDSNEFGKKFYFADNSKGQFAELPMEEFTKRFECYDMDLEINNGLRFWEVSQDRSTSVDLSRTSGMIASDKGGGR